MYKFCFTIKQKILQESAYVNLNEAILAKHHISFHFRILFSHLDIWFLSAFLVIK